jgi:NAD(P)-dependent dehydrogenase (short-subunit alcohol dehydrogenase family)
MEANQVFNLKGKVAIITGASKGIGRAIAEHFSANGASVVINSRKQDALDLVAKEISNETGNEVLPIAGNAGDIVFLNELLNATVKKFGGVDIIVNNAATNPVYGPSLECDSLAFDKIMGINVRTPFEFAKIAHPIMKARGGGSIINVSSIAGITPDPGLGMYSVSKSALNMLTKVLAKEWGADGIRVNSICPGLIKTKFSQALWQDEKTLAHFTKRLPIARMGTTDEIAALALYLASDASKYTTGAILPVDGGTVV